MSALGVIGATDGAGQLGGAELLRGDGIGDEREDDMITIDGAGPPRSPLPVGAVEGTAGLAGAALP